MKIILIGPRTYNGFIDGIVWNFQLPLQSLGHEVFLLDVSRGDNNEKLQKMIDEKKPDLIFSILTVGDKPPFFEPIDVIKKYTENGLIKTFNWFCDDTWRFDNFSSQMCHNFLCCSTTEQQCVEKYKQIGYNNIFEANWHVNEDLYSHHRNNSVISFKVSFIGKLYDERREYIEFCRQNGIEISVFENLSFEQMIAVMSQSSICLNFSSNPNGPRGNTQMKGRMFEIPATGALMVTQYHPGLENYFKENQEAVFFNTKEQLVAKLRKLLDEPAIALRLSERGFQRYLEEHTSKLRLKKLLDDIKNL